MHTLQSLLGESGYLLADGAMGTMLFAAGLGHGGSPELWNVEHPDKVAAVHREYLEAGARILLTNTFGCNRFRLQLHNLEARTAEFNRAAARLLRLEVDASGKRALVAGDIGPTGGLIQPLGELTSEDVSDAFAEQAAALIEGGVDLIWIETMAALEEIQAAVAGVRRSSADIPIITTMTFDTRGRTMMGITPERAIRELSLYGAAAIGGNCGNGPEEIIAVVEKMRQTAPDAILVAKANAGVPVLEKGRPVYRATPEDMAVYAVQAYNAGAQIIGACCGSTPDHIRAIAAALKSA
jgi:5-methyltetrahydrofolate--homocysteine methyltransferase